MLEDLFFDNLDTFDDIDISDIEHSTDFTNDSYDFCDSFIYTEDLDLDNYDELQKLSLEVSDDDKIVGTQQEHHHEPIKKSQISFGLGTHCIEYGCHCGNFRGTFGAVCTNCGHGYDKHF